MKLELAKVGKFHGAEITKEMLSDIVETFSGRVPIRFGHDQEGGTALGSVDSVDFLKKTLSGDISRTPMLEWMMEDKAILNWSVGLSLNDEKKWYIHHLAMLGSTPPRIPGLQVLEMSNKDSDIKMSIEFSQNIKPKELEVEMPNEFEKENINLSNKLKAKDEEMNKMKGMVITGKVDSLFSNINVDSKEQKSELVSLFSQMEIANVEKIISLFSSVIKSIPVETKEIKNVELNASDKPAGKTAEEKQAEFYKELSNFK